MFHYLKTTYIICTFFCKIYPQWIYYTLFLSLVISMIFAIDLPEACELWGYTICCTQEVRVVTLKEVNPATLIDFKTGKWFMCTCIREWRNFKSIYCLSSILTSLQSSHVDGEYIIFVMTWISWFFSFC
jgi:hypothetical protein